MKENKIGNVCMTKDIKNVRIQPGCISCGTCQFICPEVFEVTDRSRVKENIDFSQYSEKIKEAVRACPVKVIVGEEE